LIDVANISGYLHAFTGNVPPFLSDIDSTTTVPAHR
jgi:hypothetical protein